jgi:hypothetical protein
MLILGSCKSKEPVPGDVLLLHFNGTDGATTTTDSSPSNHTLTANGTAQLDTAQAKFGTASSLHETYDNYWSISSHANFAFGTGDFTIEAWVRIPSVISFGSRVITLLGTKNLFFSLQSGRISFYDNSGNGNYGDEGAAISTNTWTHIAVTRASGTIRGFKDGVKQWESAYSDNVGTTGSSVEIGSSASGAQFDGHIDEIRIRKACLYTTDFTPASSEY